MCVPPGYLACSIICDRAKHQLAKANPDGINNSDASQTFALQSDYKGGSKDYSS
jgi:hypothetical protein